MQRAGALLPSFGPTTEGGPPATMEQSLAMRPRPPEQVSATRLAGASEGAYEPYRVAPNRVAPDHDPRSRRRGPDRPTPSRPWRGDAQNAAIPNPHRHFAPGHTFSQRSAPTELLAEVSTPFFWISSLPHSLRDCCHPIL